MGMQGELLELLKGADMDGNQTLDYREFLAATMEKVRGTVSCNQVKVTLTLGTLRMDRGPYEVSIQGSLPQCDNPPPPPSKIRRGI